MIFKIVTHLSWPLTMIPTREHKASASSMEWVVRIAPRFPWTFLLMVFLIRGSETKENVKYKVHMKKKKKKWKGIEDQTSFFWYQNSKKLVAEQVWFSRETSKTHPANDKCFGAKKQQAMDDRRFGKRFRRKNNDNRAVNVGRLGAKQDWKRFRRSRVSEKSAKIFRPRLRAAFARKQQIAWQCANIRQ